MARPFCLKSSISISALRGRFPALFATRKRGVAPGTLVIHDAFTDTNGVLLTAHTVAPVNTPGHSWTDILLTNAIQSNVAAFNGAGPTMQVIETHLADCRVVVTYHQEGASLASVAGLALRSTSSTNSWRCGIYITTAMLQIREGVSTVRAESAFTATAHHDCTLEGTVSGSTITMRMWDNDTPGTVVTCSYASATMNQTVTTHGVLGKNTNNVEDDFIVYTV